MVFVMVWFYLNGGVVSNYRDIDFANIIAGRKNNNAIE
jgi:hypothetical protein